MGKKILQFDLYDSQDVLNGSSGEITSPDVTIRNKFHPQGLFSQQIFGPVNNMSCECGAFTGQIFAGHTCPKCLVTVDSNKVRFHRYGHISLAMPVLTDLGASYLKKFVSVPSFSTLETQFEGYLYCYAKLCSETEHGFYFKDGTKVAIHWTGNSELPEEEYKLLGIGTVGLYQFLENLDMNLLLKYFQHERKPDQVEILSSLIKKGRNLTSFLITHLYVIPAGYRSVTRDGLVPPLNTYYMSIIKRNDRLRATQHLAEELRIFDLVIMKEYLMLAQGINQLHVGNATFNGVKIPGLMESLSGKSGIIRGKMLGRQSDYTGRSVIVSDPTLSLDEDEILLPYEMVKEVFRPVIYRYIKQAKELKKGSNRQISHIFMTDHELVKDIVFNHIHGKYPVIMNRQPTLHLFGMLGFTIKVNKDLKNKAIYINPSIMSGFNADCDGDTVQMIFPMMETTQNGVREKMMASKNIHNSSHGSILTFGQDITMGLWCATAPEMNKDKNPGKDALNALFEEFNLSYRVDDSYMPMNKSNVSKMILDLQRLNAPLKVLDRIKLLGFYYATKYGVSITLDDITPYENAPDNLSIKEFNSYVDECFKDLSSKKNSFNSFLNSKARGSKNQVQQVLVAKGILMDINGGLLDPIKNSLATGLTKKEFISSIVGSRKGLINKVLSVAKSGYFTAKLVKSSRDTRLSSVEDCGSEEYAIYPMSKNLIGRVLKDGRVIDDSVERELHGKEVEVRSPLFCKCTSGICKTCYGRLPHKNLQVPENEYNVGVLAGQSLGEPATQLLLRVFHTSGSASVSKSTISAEYDQTFNIVQNDAITQLHVNGKVYVCHKDSVKILSSNHEVKKGDPVAEFSTSMGDISTKFPTIEGMFTCNTPDSNGKATLSPATGILRLSQIVTNISEEPIASGSIIMKPKVEIYAQCYIEGHQHSFNIDILKTPMIVPFNSEVTIGQCLTSGSVDFNALYKLVSKTEFIKRFILTASSLYASEGVDLPHIHFEIILRTMLSKCIVTGSNDPEYPVGEIVDRNELALNPNLQGEEILLSIMNVGLSRSFFQHLSLGYITSAMKKILTTYKEVGHTTADKICLELPYTD